ncbi:MAG: hypothetical protein EHM61_28060 [Acidobacteria bacterium]|nr:MAG: hypothetical protein EHM61_28060 [Acidobacteriota bacterium]
MRRAALLLIILTAFRIARAEQEVIPRPENPDRQRRQLTEWRTIPVEEGKTVKVKPVPEVTLTFPEVLKKGAITFRLLFEGPKGNAGYLVGSPPVFLEMAGGLEYQGPVEICINFAPQLFPDGGTDLRVLRRQDKSWVDETRTLDREKNVVCAQVPKLGLILLAVRSVTGLYDDLAATMRLIPSEELQQDLADPVLKSREAALKGERPLFEQQLKGIKEQVAGAGADKLPPQVRDWITYFLNRLDARVTDKPARN